MSGAIAATDDSLIISCEYDATGLEWVILHDNVTLGWRTDDPVTPIIIGSMAPPPPATAPVLSPQWAKYARGTIFAPDMWRGGAAEFFTNIATNNGARRPIYAKFYDADLASQFQQWGLGFPDLVLSDPPNV